MRRLARQNIQITIVDDSKVMRCEARCGVDWSLATNLNTARQLAKERFTQDISIEYLDLARPTGDDGFFEWQNKINRDDLTLPLLVINGKLRVSGEFDFRTLMDAIDTEIEIKSYR